MKKVFKYKLLLEGSLVKMPKGAKLLRANNQGDDFYVWAEVDPNEEIVDHIIVVYGTGHYISGEGAYVDTIFWKNLVFHVYDYGEREQQI